MAVWLAPLAGTAARAVRKVMNAYQAGCLTVKLISDDHNQRNCGGDPGTDTQKAMHWQAEELMRRSCHQQEVGQNQQNKHPYKEQVQFFPVSNVEGREYSQMDAENNQ